MSAKINRKHGPFELVFRRQRQTVLEESHLCLMRYFKFYFLLKRIYFDASISGWLDP